MKQIILTLTMLMSAFSCFAQDKKWTLNECMQYAVENSPRTNKQKSQNSIYHQDYLEAIGNLLPSLGARVGTDFNFGRGLDSETNTYADVNSFSNNYSLSTSLTLFDGLSNINRVKMGKVSKVMGKELLEQERDMVAYDTMDAFFTVLYNIDMVKIAQQQLEESTKNLHQIKRMEELGVKGFPDVSEMQAKEAEDNYNLTRQNNMLTISIIILKEKMNFPIDENLLIADERYDNFIVKIDETAYNIYSQSKNYNPKAKAAESTLKRQKLNHKVAKGGLFPQISLNAGISTNFFRYMDGSEYSSFRDQIKNKKGQYIGFSLSIPIFSGFSRTASVKRTKEQVYMAEMDRDDVFRKLYSEIEQSVSDANGQVDEYNQAVKQKDAAEVAHKVNQKKYNEGMIDAIVLHTSSNRLLKARAEELNAKFKYQLKYKLVNYYKGEPFIVMK